MNCLIAFHIHCNWFSLFLLFSVLLCSSCRADKDRELPVRYHSEGKIKETSVSTRFLLKPLTQDPKASLRESDATVVISRRGDDEMQFSMFESLLKPRKNGGFSGIWFAHRNGAEFIMHGVPDEFRSKAFSFIEKQLIEAALISVFWPLEEDGQGVLDLTIVPLQALSPQRNPPDGFSRKKEYAVAYYIDGHFLIAYLSLNDVWVFLEELETETDVLSQLKRAPSVTEFWSR